MFSTLDVFQTAYDMARHAGARQAVVARNIANADTPGYRAQEIAPFRDHVRAGTTVTAQATRAGHLASTTVHAPPRPHNSNAEPTPNGNSVSLELELMTATEVQREHGRALAIYRHSLDLLRSSIGRR